MISRFPQYKLKLFLACHSEQNMSFFDTLPDFEEEDDLSSFMTRYGYTNDMYPEVPNDTLLMMERTMKIGAKSEKAKV